MSVTNLVEMHQVEEPSYSQTNEALMTSVNQAVGDLGVRAVSLRQGRLRLRYLDGRDASVRESMNVLAQVKARISERRQLRRAVRGRVNDLVIL